jgi:hypothetical protein
MTEKEKVILRHVELAKEYTRLSNSDHSLGPEVWKSISKRMEEIQQEIEELRAIEHTWDEYQDHKEKEKSKLDMISQDELAKMLNVHRNNITMLREVGIIQAIKLGKCYMFTQEEIKRFQHDYRGFDVSNRIKAIEAYKAVNGGIS